jgi:hypothetical protein
MVVIPTKYKYLYGWADCIGMFIRVAKQLNTMHIVPVEATFRLVHLLRENSISGNIYSVWLVDNHVEFDTYWTVYQLDQNA